MHKLLRAALRARLCSYALGIFLVGQFYDPHVTQGFLAGAGGSTRPRPSTNTPSPWSWHEPDLFAFPSTRFYAVLVSKIPGNSSFFSEFPGGLTNQYCDRHCVSNRDEICISYFLNPYILELNGVKMGSEIKKYNS